MKKDTSKPTDSKGKSQSNIGYENTKKRNDQDDQENNRTQTTDTGKGEGPVENEADTEGLRSESGKKSMGKKSGNNEKGD